MAMCFPVAVDDLLCFNGFFFLRSFSCEGTGLRALVAELLKNIAFRIVVAQVMVFKVLTTRYQAWTEWL